MRTGRRPTGSHKPGRSVQLRGPQLISSRAGRRSAGSHKPGMLGSSPRLRDCYRPGRPTGRAGRSRACLLWVRLPLRSLATSWGRARARAVSCKHGVGVRLPAIPLRRAKWACGLGGMTPVWHAGSPGSTPGGSTVIGCAAAGAGRGVRTTSGRLGFVPCPASVAAHPVVTEGSRIRLAGSLC